MSFFIQTKWLPRPQNITGIPVIGARVGFPRGHSGACGAFEYSLHCSLIHPPRDVLKSKDPTEKQATKWPPPTADRRDNY